MRFRKKGAEDLYDLEYFHQRYARQAIGYTAHGKSSKPDSCSYSATQIEENPNIIKWKKEVYEPYPRSTIFMILYFI